MLWAQKIQLSNQFFLGLPLPLLTGASLGGEVSSKSLFLGLPLPLLGGVAGEHGGGGVKMTGDLSGQLGGCGVKMTEFVSNIVDFDFCLLLCFCTDFLLAGSN